MRKTCIIISGPTAVGKTALALDIASHYGSKIISADSRQCYKELNIGVAKPAPADLLSIPHYFINSHSVKDDLSAADFESYALAAANEIFLENDIAIMTGGTGLYIKAFCEGLDAIPATDSAVRNEVLKNYQNHGIEYLQSSIKKEDPEFYAVGEMQNPQRMMRALEVVLSTGRSIISFRSQQKKTRDFDIIKIGLQLPREILYERINNRVDEMIENGLLEEVTGLLPFKELNALQTVGYKELFEYLEGRISLPRAIELIKQNSRHYAKRQLTWFKKDEEMQWCEPVLEVVLEMIGGRLGESESEF